jgi:hypothetical protein
MKPPLYRPAADLLAALDFGQGDGFVFSVKDLIFGSCSPLIEVFSSDSNLVFLAAYIELQHVVLPM